MHAEDSRWISWIWRVALLAAVATQLFMMSLRTSAGARIIPGALLRAHIVRPRQARGLTNSVRQVGGGAVLALTREIEQNVPSDCSMEVVWNGPKMPEEIADLAYRIYPRSFSQRDGVAGDQTDAKCRIDWASDTDITVSTPTSTWRYQAGGASSK